MKNKKGCTALPHKKQKSYKGHQGPCINNV